MTINTNIITSNSSTAWKNLSHTIVHETRHCYQHEAVDNPDKHPVSSATRNAWDNDFKHYRDANTYGFDSYASQPVEFDAKEFAHDYVPPNLVPDYPGSWG